MVESELFESVIGNKKEPLKEARNASEWGERFNNEYADFMDESDFRNVEDHARILFREAAHKLIQEAMWTVSNEEANHVVEKMLDVFFDTDSWTEAVDDPIQ